MVADDYYSSEEAKPQTDVSLGGRNDVQVVAGSRTSTSTSLTVKRKIITGDKYDKDISLTSANDMIYAWDTADNTGIGYHGDNHNHVFIDFSRPDGIPLNTFGEEESGVLSRRLVRDMYFGTLSTFQTEKAGAVSNFPFGTVSDFADDGTGRPIILLSNLERSVINMQTSPSCSLSIQQAPNTTLEFTHPEVYDVMTKPRTTLMGKLTPVPKEELDQAKAIYLSKHPKSKAWINFSDFTMYYMAVEDIYVIAGFGNDHYIGWISPAQYYSVTI